MRTILDFHILQTVPPSNLNRDDTGSPKTAVYGGVRRARVSSQAWKRATRTAFKEHFRAEDLGVRTRRVVELVSNEIESLDPELRDRADDLAARILKQVGIVLAAPKKKAQERPEPEQSGYLLFLSRRQVQHLSRLAVEAASSDDLEKAMAAAKDQARRASDRDHSVDIALFGRMVADQADLNVDAAAQVAHAISVHAVDNEFDYFTAVDDQNPEEDTGAGMIGTVEFNSSTLYRYATVDVDALQDNLGSAEATVRAVEAFAASWIRSMPTGKQNTFAHRTLPEAVVVMLRDSQPINLVQAFEAAILPTSRHGRVAEAATRLAEEAAEIERAYGEAPLCAWVTRLGSDTAALDSIGPSVAFDELLRQLREQVQQRLSLAASHG